MRLAVLSIALLLASPAGAAPAGPLRRPVPAKAQGIGALPQVLPSIHTPAPPVSFQIQAPLSLPSAAGTAPSLRERPFFGLAGPLVPRVARPERAKQPVRGAALERSAALKGKKSLSAAHQAGARVFDGLVPARGEASREAAGAAAPAGTAGEFQVRFTERFQRAADRHLRVNGRGLWDGGLWHRLNQDIQGLADGRPSKKMRLSKRGRAKEAGIWRIKWQNAHLRVFFHVSQDGLSATLLDIRSKSKAGRLERWEEEEFYDLLADYVEKGMERDVLHSDSKAAHALGKLLKPILPSARLQP